MGFTPAPRPPIPLRAWSSNQQEERFCNCEAIRACGWARDLDGWGVAQVLQTEPVHP